jgi:hypothetical protein
MLSIGVIYIYTHTLFITLGDGPIGPSPGPASPLTDRVRHAHHEPRAPALTPH